MKISKITMLGILSLIFMMQQSEALVQFKITNESASDLEVSGVIIKPGKNILVGNPPIVVRLKGGTPQDYVFINCTDNACTKFTDEKSGALTSNCNFNYIPGFDIPKCSIYKH